MKKFGIYWIGIVLLSPQAFASTEGIVDGKTLAPVTLDQITAQVRPGGILIVSEIHDAKIHHDHQVDLLNSLAKYQKYVSVGLEFFERPNQSDVDQFVSGQIAEAAFLNQIHWGSIPFDFYRSQALFPKTHQGFTLALNAPRSLTGKIAKNGLDALTPDEKSQLPEGFALGNTLYLERFKEAMQDHVPPPAIERYFEAQSVWDDTMAATAVDFLKGHPEQTLVILVGDFHAQYGGGLPDRLRARGQQELWVVSQILTDGLSDQDVQSLEKPDPRYGQRADWVWASARSP